MKQADVEKWIKELIEKDELWKFYKSQQWTKLKKEILKANHYECAECRKQGVVTRYDIDADGNKTLLSTVHHVQFVRKHPELALSRIYTYQGKVYQNLIPVCKACHNKLHPEKHNKANKADKELHYVNEERW